jgi:hypothetical protein
MLILIYTSFLPRHFTPLHIQNALFLGSCEWHGTITLRILNAQRCKKLKFYISYQVKLSLVKNIFVLNFRLIIRANAIFIRFNFLLGGG